MTADTNEFDQLLAAREHIRVHRNGQSSGSGDAFERITDALRAAGKVVRSTTHGKAMAQCPAHEDHDPSLSITALPDRVLLWCFPGCDNRDIVAAVGLRMGDLYNDRRGADYPYPDGTTVHRRYKSNGKKKIWQENPTPPGQLTPLWHLAELKQGIAEGKVVWLVGGEDDVLTLEALGEVATSARGGEANLHNADLSPLHGAQVICVLDRDETGLTMGRQVTASLHGRAASLDFMIPKVERPKADVSDHIAAGYSLDELVPTILPGDETPGPQNDGGETDQHIAVRERFPRLDLAALLSAQRPAREWLWWRLIPVGCAVALVAPAGTGKSLLVQALMVAVARGDRAFAGLRISNRRVFLIDMENTEDDLAERFRDLGITVDEVASLDNLVFIHLPRLSPLDTPAGGWELEAALDAYGIRIGDVVVLDSTQRVVTGKENDSDTIRAYYLCTGLMLKRRGITVIRTDNTGKDLERGARGTSSKRDDVDVELFMTPDAGRPGRVSIKPGKIRLPDIDSITIDRQIDEDGRIYYSTAGDPFRAKILDAIAGLDRHAIPLETGEKKAAEMLKAKGETIVRAALRIAIKERRDLEKGAPTPHGAPPFEAEPSDYAEDQRRSTAQQGKTDESERERYAE